MPKERTFNIPVPILCISSYAGNAAQITCVGNSSPLGTGSVRGAHSACSWISYSTGKGTNRRRLELPYIQFTERFDMQCHMGINASD